MIANNVAREPISNAPIVRGATAGLIAGLFASFAMDRFQAAITALSSSDSDAEPATDKAAGRIFEALTGRELTSTNKPVGGQVVHYGLGAGLGALYGTAAEYRRDVTIGYGTASGIGVAVFLDDTVVSAVGLDDPP